MSVEFCPCCLPKPGIEGIRAMRAVQGPRAFPLQDQVLKKGALPEDLSTVKMKGFNKPTSQKEYHDRIPSKIGKSIFSKMLEIKRSKNMRINDILYIHISII